MSMEDCRDESDRFESAPSSRGSPTNDASTNYGTSPATSGSSKNGLLSGPIKEASSKFRMAETLFPPAVRNMGNPIQDNSGTSPNPQYVFTTSPQIPSSKDQKPRLYQEVNAQDIRTQYNLTIPSPPPDITAWLSKVPGPLTTIPEDPLSKYIEAKDKSRDPQIEKQKPADSSAGAHEQNLSAEDDVDGHTPLVQIAEQGGENLLKSTTLEKIRKFHERTLHAAMILGEATLIQMLFNAAAVEIQVKGRDGFLATDYALATSNIRILKWFLDHGADLDERDREDTTIFHRIAAAGLAKSAKFLVRNVADAHKTTKDGCTALNCAVVGAGHKQMFQLLLANGADTGAKNGLGHTPLHVTVEQWRSQTIFKILESLTANVKTRNHNRETTLYITVHTQNAGVIRWPSIKGVAQHDVISKEGSPLHELNRVSVSHKFDEIMLKGQDLMSYYLWCTLQSLVQNDKSFQKFKGAVSQAAIAKDQRISEILEFKAALGDGKYRSLLIGFFPPTVESPSTNFKVIGRILGGFYDQATSLDGKQIRSSSLVSTSAIPHDTKDRIESVVGIAEAHEIEEGLGHVTGENPNCDYFPRIVPTVKIPGTRREMSQVRSSSSSSAVSPKNNSREERDTDSRHECEDMREVLDNEARVQAVTGAIHDDIPREPSTSLINKYKCSNFDRKSDYPLMILSDCTQKSAGRVKNPATDTPHRHPQDFTKSSLSSDVSVCERQDPPEIDRSSFLQHTPARSDESFLSDNDESGSESSDVTDSSDEMKEMKGDFVPSLDQLGRAAAPKLALSLEAIRMAISEILSRLSATTGVSSEAGETSSYTTGSGYPQSVSLDSSFDQRNSGQTSKNGNAPFGNGGNENNGMGHDGSENYGDDNEDGDGDDRSMLGQATTKSGHCACCPYSQSKPGTGSKQPGPLVVTGTASLKFACPYFKHNPNHRFEGQSCRGPGWSDVSRVKEHIYRRHLLPIRCPRCGDLFDDDTMLSAHLQKVVPCDLRKLEELEGCNKEQEKHLRSRKGMRGRKDVDRWRNVYSTLFPNVLVPNIPSPYHLIPHVDAAIVLEITSSFSQFFKDKFSKRFADEYSAATVFDLGEIVDKHTNKILREYQEMKGSYDAASQKSSTDTRSIASSRKKLRPAISPTTGFETTATASHPNHFEHQPQPTNSSHPLRPYGHVVPQADATNESAISNIPGITNPPQWNDSIPSSSSASQQPEISEITTNVEEYELLPQSSASFSAAPQLSEDIFEDLFNFTSFQAYNDQDPFGIIGRQVPTEQGVLDHEARARGGNQSLNIGIGIEPGITFNANEKFQYSF